MPGMGERKLFFEDVQEGDTAPALSHTVTRTDLVRYAGASGDFNPMHHDDVKAREAGLPSVFAHGMFSAGFLARALTDWVGVGNLRRFKVRFVKQVWPDETLTATHTVTAKRKEDGANLVDVECALTNDKGDVVVSGEATAELPSR
jgi:acyl dehydratase